MSLKTRIYHTIRLCLIKSGMDRAKYLKKHNIFGHIGDKVLIMPRKIPLYPELIKIHDNVRIASNVTFITHDVIHHMLNEKYKTKDFVENIGCIEIMDNVFIGADTKIMYNVRIESNVIVAAGSIVTKDVPKNTIVAGVPAKPIGKFDDYVKKTRANLGAYPKNLRPQSQKIPKELQQILWEQFNQKKK